MKVLFIDTVHPILWDRLIAHNFQCVDGTSLSKEAIFAEINNFHGLVIRSRFPVNRDFLVKATSLRFIARSGSGMENIDITTAKEQGISLYNSPEGNKVAVAEHALGMLLSLFNNLKHGDDQVRNGVWDREGNRGVEIAGKTVGVIGYGHNGSAFSKALSGMDCKILAYDKYKKNYAPSFVEEVDMTRIFMDSDILSLHIPLTNETQNLIDKSFIKKMANPFYLINTSRGPIAKTSAIVSGLTSGKIKGACLDVLDIENSSFEIDRTIDPDFSVLTELKNVILSPHVAGWSIESYKKLSSILADKILADFKA